MSGVTDPPSGDSEGENRRESVAAQRAAAALDAILKLEQETGQLGPAEELRRLDPEARKLLEEMLEDVHRLRRHREALGALPTAGALLGPLPARRGDRSGEHQHGLARARRVHPAPGRRQGTPPRARPLRAAADSLQARIDHRRAHRPPRRPGPPRRGLPPRCALHRDRVRGGRPHPHGSPGGGAQGAPPARQPHGRSLSSSRLPAVWRSCTRRASSTGTSSPPTS